MKKKSYKKIIFTLINGVFFSYMAHTQTSVTYSYTGAMQTFTVPSCVNSVTVDVMGSKGGDCIYNLSTKPDDLGGLGGRVVAVYPVTPGQVLNVFVGGIPYNGGGNGAGSIAQAHGGGASDIRIGGVALANRVIVAGGGAGGGNNCSTNAEPGGAGGGLIGETGWQCGNQTGTAVGQGGTQSAGGVAGTSPATAGNLGVGGNAGGAGTASGGGGGGYYGGGGAAYGGGGGGSSYTDALASSVVHTQGFQNSTGLVVISYTTGPTILAVTNNTLLCSGQTATLSASGANTYTWSSSDNTANIVITPTTSITYTVSGSDINGCVNSTTITQNVNICTGVNTMLDKDLLFNIYPNPNKGLFVVEVAASSTIQITNTLGQVVFSEIIHAGKHDIDIQDMLAGVYFVKINNNTPIKLIKKEINE